MTVVLVFIVITCVLYKCADEFVGSHWSAHHQGDGEAVNEQAVYQPGHVLREPGWPESSEAGISASSYMPSDHWYDVFLRNVLCMCFCKICRICLQCFNAVGLAAGRAASLWCRFLYGPADATATHCLLLQ